MSTPDNTPSADARELFPERNPIPDYGDANWRRSGKIGLTNQVSVETIPEPEADFEQLNLFDDLAVPMPDHIKNLMSSKPKREDQDTYGHLIGPSASVLRDHDRRAIADLSRRQP
jgi:hypothetical protein